MKKPTPTPNRRQFFQQATTLGAAAAWSHHTSAAPATPSRRNWTERRDRFPEGVASGDPDAHSVLLWTRCPGEQDASAPNPFASPSKSPKTPPSTT